MVSGKIKNLNFSNYIVYLSNMLYIYHRYLGLEVVMLFVLLVSFSVSYYFWGIGLVLGAQGTGLVPGYVSEDIAQFIMYSTIMLFIVRWVCLRYFPTSIGTFYMVMGLWFMVAFYRWYTIAQVGIQISNMLGLFWLLVLLFLFVRGVFKHYETKNVVNKSPSAVVVASLFEEILMSFISATAVLFFLELQVRDKRPKISLFLHENLGFDLWSVGLGMYCIQSFIFFCGCPYWLLLLCGCLTLCSASYMLERNKFLPAYMLTDTWFLKKFDEYSKALCEERGIVFFSSSEVVHAPLTGLNDMVISGGNAGGQNTGGQNTSGTNDSKFSSRMHRGIAYVSSQSPMFTAGVTLLGVGLGFALSVGGLSVNVKVARDYASSVRIFEAASHNQMDAINTMASEYQKSEELKRQFLSWVMANNISMNAQLASELTDNSKLEVKSGEVFKTQSLMDVSMISMMKDSAVNPQTLLPPLMNPPTPPFEIMDSVDVDTSEYSLDEKSKGKFSKMKK